MSERAEEKRLLFVGDDWAEAHHDVEIRDETGRRLARRKLPEGVAGIGQLHALLAEHLCVDAEPDQVVVGIETDRGPWVAALLAAGYQVVRDQPALGGYRAEPTHSHAAMSLLGRCRSGPVAPPAAETDQ